MAGRLTRILEPEVMDTADEAVAYDTMDHSHVNRVFVSDFLQVWNGGEPIADIGTGTAQIPIEFCRQSARGTIVAIDAAEEMLKIARRNVERAGLADRILLERVDAKAMSASAGRFGAVMSNSIVHHIPEPRAVFAEMVRIARPGATFFVRDLMRPFDQAELDRIVSVYAADADATQRQLFSDSLHAALTVDEVREIVASLGFDPADVRATSDRHWTWATARSDPHGHRETASGG